MDAQEFAGKVALVTGTTGIGRAIALRFAAAGAQVVACGIEPKANEELTTEVLRLGSKLKVEDCDVTNETQLRSVVAKTVSRFGGCLLYTSM